MNVRIQTTGMTCYFLIYRRNVELCTDCVVSDATTALEALEKGFNDLMDLCDVVTEKFTASRDQFNAESGNRMEA